MVLSILLQNEQNWGFVKPNLTRIKHLLCDLKQVFVYFSVAPSILLQAEQNWGSVKPNLTGIKEFF